MSGLDRQFRDADQQQRNTCRGLRHSVIERQRRLDSIAAQVAQLANDAGHLCLVHARGLTVIVHAEHQITTIGVVGESHQMFGQAVLLIGQLGFPVQLIEFMRHRHQALGKDLKGFADPELGCHVIASA